MMQFFFEDAPKLPNQIHNDLRVNGAATVAQAAHRLRDTVVSLRAHPIMDDVHRVEPIGESEGAIDGSGCRPGQFSPLQSIVTSGRRLSAVPGLSSQLSTTPGAFTTLWFASKASKRGHSVVRSMQVSNLDYGTGCKSVRTQKSRHKVKRIWVHGIMPHSDSSRYYFPLSKPNLTAGLCLYSMNSWRCPVGTVQLRRAPGFSALSQLVTVHVH